VEGVIVVESVGTFVKKERGTGRVNVTFTLDEATINRAASALNYPPLSDRERAFMYDKHPYNIIP